MNLTHGDLATPLGIQVEDVFLIINYKLVIYSQLK